MKKKIIHLIPIDGLGGVEQAARSLEPFKDLDIQIAFLCGNSLSKNKLIREVSGPTVGLNSPKFYFNSLRYLFKENPDMVVSSLWRSHIVSIPYTIYRKLIVRDDFKYVSFVHAVKHSRKLEWLLMRISFELSDEIWCDSVASKKGIDQFHSYKNKTHSISFFTKVVQNQSAIQNYHSKENNLIFWGRLSTQKRVDKAIILFSQILEKKPNLNFYIYGPDDGDLENLQRIVNSLKITDKVKFMGPKKPGLYPAEALNSKFFINTSSNEGMAIAVTEAMQLGLVPIVTPVGEIANYCTDGENSIYYNDKTVDKVISLMNNLSDYEKMSRKAVAYWSNVSTYSDDFKSNCLRLIRGKND